MTPLARQLGFTLIEVLVAFSIFSTALALIYQIYARGGAAAVLAGEYTTAVGVAEAQLARASVADRLLIDADGGADRGVALGKYHWRVTAEAWDNPIAPAPQESAYGLKRVVAQVTWQSRGGQRQIILNGLKPYRVSPRGGP